MARTFWDRWQWELQKRKEAIQEVPSPLCSSKPKVHIIDPASLHDPTIDSKPTEVYIGRGSFSVVRLQYYRGMKVAVKEFLPRSIKVDVTNEAAILSLLNHPYLPYIFGMCTSSLPYRIVLQFHGIGFETISLSKELADGNARFNSPETWLLFCSQIVDAVQYLHDNVKVIHNDLKGNNIIIATLPSQEASSSSASPVSVLPSSDITPFPHHIVVIDFGKTESMSNAKRYDIPEADRAQYLTKYPHIAPEIVYGQSKQSPYSDMYSIGKVFKVLAERGCFADLSDRDAQEIDSLINSLTSVLWHARPTAGDCLNIMEQFFN